MKRRKEKTKTKMGETASYIPICEHSRSSPTPERLQKHEEQRGRCRIQFGR
jgi:hypothetical protein